MRRLAPLAFALVLAVPVGARPLDEPGARVDERLNWTTVVPGRLAVGSGGLDEGDVRYLAEQGFGAVLNMRIEHEDPDGALAEHGLAYLHVPLGMAELDTFDDEEIDASVAFIREQNAEGRAVYVHCTAGWHRAAIAVAAWIMEEEDVSADEAWERLEALRPQVEPRWIDGLYGREARRDARPQLEVDLRVPGTTAEIGEDLDVVATVTVGGRPFEGATVRFVAEYDDLEVDVPTDADGVARLDLEMDESHTQFVSAHARADGLVPGYDRVAIWSARTGIGAQEPFTLEVDAPTEPVQPGAEVRVRLEAREADGDPMNARVSITDGARTLWRSYVEHDGDDVAVVRAPETPGAHELDVRATSPYVEGVRARLVVEVASPPEPAAPPSPPQPVATTPPTTSTEPPAGPETDAPAPAPSSPSLAPLAYAVAAAAVAALAVRQVRASRSRRLP